MTAIAARAAGIALARGNPIEGRPRITPVMSLAATGPPGAGAGPDGPAAAPPDVTLIELIAARDPDALATLYHRHGSACYRLARQITANATLAEDAVQEAFVGLWKAPASYVRGRGSVRSWLLSLTHHKAVDLVRRETAEQRRQGAQAVQQTADPPEGEDPAVAAWRDMQAAEVRAGLLELPEAQRRALTLAYYGGYTQSQIAELTGVPLGTVKTRMLSAMRRLRLRLGPRTGVPGEDHRD
jgi:RNA polymerase sigma factor (sigma-70 family)